MHEVVATTQSSDLITSLKLREHPEGGYFVETDSQNEQVPSPFADGSVRPLATSIFYLLTYDRPYGFIHMNKSVTYHVLHQGRAEYTLITPGNPPRVEKKIIGVDTAAGEQRLLIVGTGVWKMSRLLNEDLRGTGSEDEKGYINCLITEVVVPGFAWDDHKYLTRAELEDLFRGEVEQMEELGRFVKN